MLQKNDDARLAEDLFYLASGLVNRLEGFVRAEFRAGPEVEIRTLRVAVGRFHERFHPSIMAEVIPSLPPRIQFLPAAEFKARQKWQEEQEARRDELGYGHRD